MAFFQQRTSIYILFCIVFSKLWWFMFVKFKCTVEQDSTQKIPQEFNINC